MISVPDGRTATGSRHLFRPADEGLVPWGAGQLGRDRLARLLRFLDGFGRQLLQARLLSGCRRCVDACVARCTELGCQLTIVLAWVLAGPSSDLCRKQVYD